MADNRRWFIPVRRTVISIVVGIIAIFVIFGSWGMNSWRWLSVGIALLAGAAGLAVISAMTSTIRGTAHVLAVNEPPAVKHFGRCTLSVIVNAKNTEPLFIKLLEDDVPLEKWPHVKDDLPIAVAANDARVITVLWDQVPTHKKLSTARRRAEAREGARDEAQRAAQQAEAGPVIDDLPEPDGPGPTPDDDVPTVYAQAVPEPDPISDGNGGKLVNAAHGAGVVLDLPPSEYSVMPGDTVVANATAVITSGASHRKPSPRPRPRPAADDLDVDALDTDATAADHMGAAPVGGDPVGAALPDATASSEPIQVGHIGLVTPIVAPPDGDAPYDQDDDTT